MVSVFEGRGIGAVERATRLLKSFSRGVALCWSGDSDGVLILGG
jgi:hypothetical protein